MLVQRKIKAVYQGDTKIRPHIPGWNGEINTAYTTKTHRLSGSYYWYPIGYNDSTSVGYFCRYSSNTAYVYKTGNTSIGNISAYSGATYLQASPKCTYLLGVSNSGGYYKVINIGGFSGLESGLTGFNNQSWKAGPFTRTSNLRGGIDDEGNIATTSGGYLTYYTNNNGTYTKTNDMSVSASTSTPIVDNGYIGVGCYESSTYKFKVYKPNSSGTFDLVNTYSGIQIVDIASSEKYIIQGGSGTTYKLFEKGIK